MSLQHDGLEDRLDESPTPKTLRFTERSLRDLPLATARHYEIADERRPYLRCRVGLRHRVLYVVRKLRGTGKPVWHRLGRVGDRPFAEYGAEAERVAALLHQGKDPRIPKAGADGRAPTLSAGFAEYLKAKGDTLAPATIASYTQDFETMFGDWGTRSWQSITPQAVQQRHRERSLVSKSRADGGVRLIRAIWRYAKATADIRGGRFDVPDPVAEIRVTRTWNNPPPRTKYLDSNMRVKWMAAVRALPDDKPPALTGTQRDALLLEAATGLRLREAVRMPWSEFDLERGVVSVVADRMKGRVRHELPIPQRTLAMLRKRRERDPDGEFVFANRDGQPIDRISKHVFERIEVKVTSHDLRRTIATWLGSNAPGYIVKQILSHADPAKSTDVTERYVQRDIDVLRVWLQKWEDVLYSSGPRK